MRIGDSKYGHYRILGTDLIGNNLYKLSWQTGTILDGEIEIFIRTKDSYSFISSNEIKGGDLLYFGSVGLGYQIFPFLEDIKGNLSQLNIDVTEISENFGEQLKQRNIDIQKLNQIVTNLDFVNILKESLENYQNKYISGSGNLTAADGFIATDFIEIKENQNYIFNISSQVYFAWYDSNKNFISWVGVDGILPANSIYTSPNSAKYLRFSCLNTVFNNGDIHIYTDTETELNKNIKIPQNTFGKPFTENVNKKIIQNFDSIIFLSDYKYIEGKYIAPTTGGLGNNSDFNASDFIAIEELTNYYLFGFGSTYGAFYNSNQEYISGIQYDAYLPNGTMIQSPEGTAYIRISTQKTKFFDSCLSSENSYSFYPFLNFGVEEIKYIVKTVKPNGGGDFTTLSAAFDSITDSSFNKRYIVEFYGDGNEYDTLLDKPYVSGQIGLKIPPFTKLVGIGGKEKCILTRSLITSDQQDSVLNLNVTSELEGFTIIGENTRYVIHDDFGRSDELNLLNYERKVKDCHFIGKDLYYSRVYGAGIRSGAKWIFENCIFENYDENARNDSYSCHNNLNFTNPTEQKFINCRFKAHNSTSSSGIYGVWFGSLNTNANGINNNAIFWGCDIPGIRLYEENVAAYGAGILYKVSGFANTIKTGSPNIVIQNTDGVDYSKNIDLI